MPGRDDLIALYVTFMDTPGGVLQVSVETVLFSGQVDTVTTMRSGRPADVEFISKGVMKAVARVMVHYQIGR